jgi:hypothetical protein
MWGKRFEFKTDFPISLLKWREDVVEQVLENYLSR